MTTQEWSIDDGRITSRADGKVRVVALERPARRNALSPPFRDRLADAIECTSEAFVLWDSQNRLVLCNSKFQTLHELPDEAIVVGTPFDTIAAVGRHPVTRTPLKPQPSAILA